jgi:Reverse transcriptase (RNA-dependent DNA polymerase)
MLFADDMLLVAEANAKQARVIKNTLDRFALDSGLKVSKTKTKILFSNNVPLIKQNRYSRNMGFTKTHDLGKYLGMPPIKGRVTKKT